MDSSEFRKRGKEMVDFIADYMENISMRKVTPEVEPGYLRQLIPPKAPKKSQEFSDVLEDVEQAIMPGITHWQHPNFHAYFPAGNSYPSILGDMLSDGIGCVGFSWAASPACTELETIVMDWIGKMIGLPRVFLHESGVGGGVIQNSASECVLITLLAARHATIEQLKNRFSLPDDGNFVEDGTILNRLVAYSSKLAHSCVEKAGNVGLVKMRQLEVDENYSLRGYTLERAMEEDRRLGLIPFYVCATLGTTACCSFDNIKEISEVCSREKVWLHIDAAYAGNALICPEFQDLIKGIENVDSINFNPNKWMLVNSDCSLMWVQDRTQLTDALTVDPLYLLHKHAENVVTYLTFQHWGIPLSRRFRSLKLWFVIRMYGVDGLQHYIREHIRLAKLFEKFAHNDDRFEVMGKVTMGLVCFRLKGPNIMTQKLLRMLNESGKLHMVPALINEHYVIRFAVCAQNAEDDDIIFAWRIIGQLTEDLMNEKRLTKKNIEFEKMHFDNTSDDDDNVFREFEEEIIFDQQRSSLSRATKRRPIFMRMVSDPRCYNHDTCTSLCTESRRHKSECSGGKNERTHSISSTD
ncbi:hypothetical protein ScPMuIL_008351 [Solemya velum]